MTTWTNADVRRRQESCDECASCSFVVECLKKGIECPAGSCGFRVDGPPPEGQASQARTHTTTGAVRVTPTFTIPGKLPSLNDYTAANRASKFAGAELKRETEEMIGWLLTRAPHFTGRVTVHFDWYEANARRDPDNIRFAAKFILDAMTTAGIIEGDSQRYIAGLSDSFAIDRDNPRVEVTVTGV